MLRKVRVEISYGSGGGCKSVEDILGVSEDYVSGHGINGLYSIVDCCLEISK